MVIVQFGDKDDDDMIVQNNGYRAGSQWARLLAATMSLCVSFLAADLAGVSSAHAGGHAHAISSVSIGASRTSWGAATARGHSHVTSSRSIVRFASDGALSAAVATTRAGGTPVDEVWTQSVKGFAATLTAADLERLRTDPNVVGIEADAEFTALTDQTNPSWGLDRIDQTSLPLDSTYSYQSDGSGVTAYIVDTGLRSTHTEFTGRILRSAYIDFGDNTGAEDCNGHGTHVAGIIGGTTFGVAKGVSLIPVKVLNCDGSGMSTDILTALQWVVDDHVAGVPAVLNMSLGGPASSVVDAAVSAVIADGITVVVAAGNSDLNSCDYSPARVPAAITVGATNSNDSIASYSNHGSCNDLFAPGSGILSAWDTSDSDTKTISGTSMASPHVAGAAARVLEGAPTATPAQVAALLKASATAGVLTGTTSGDPNKLLFLSPSPVIPPPKEFVPLSPIRLFDTRPTEAQGVVAVVKQRYGGGNVLRVQITGLDGVPAVGVGAVSLNVTVVGAVAAGFVTVFPCGARPLVSSVNYLAGQTVSNAVIAPVSASGEVCLYSSADAYLIADISGWFATGSWFAPVAPVRVFDTRPTETQGVVAVVKQRYGGGNVLRVKVTGTSGVPASGVTAVSLNVTAVDPIAAGFVTVFPCGAQPSVSSVNYVAGQTVPNAVIAPVSALGEVCLFSSVDAYLIADVNAWFASGAGFSTVAPARLFDSRPGEAQALVAVVKQRYGGGNVLRVKVTGVGGVPPLGVGAVSLNVTVVGAVVAGFMTVFPCGSVPGVSSVNYLAGQTVPNAVIAPVSAAGEVCVYSSADAYVFADINGWFANG